MNDLVAKPQDDGKMFTGAGPLDTMEDIGANLNNPAETIKKDTNGDGVDEELRKEIEPVQLGIDVASLGLDAAGAVVDPLGTLASSAVGWIIENVGFIREPFDDLTGDPPAIEAASNTFKNISDHLKEVGEQYKAALRDVDSWQEQSGEAYRGEAKTLAEHVANASAGAATAASKIKTAGVCVAATRALIRDLIAELAGTLLTWGLPAMAASVPTAGASVAAFITRAGIKVVEIAGKIAQHLKTLFRALDELGGVARGATDALRRRADELAQSAANRAGDTPLDSALKRREEGLADQMNRRADKQEARDQKLDDFTQRRTDQADQLRQKADQFDEKARESWQRNRQDVAEGRDASGLGYDRLTARADAPSSGPLSGTAVGRAAEAVDNAAGKGMTDGQNWIRAARSGDFGHLAPGVGDAVPAIKEGAKEANKGYLQDDEEKAQTERDRTMRGQIFPHHEGGQ
ncbi:hypothetical protein [Saccharopolyspora sp. NPDC049426]|uniref:hypothetical protein n=1 Tax=Saccharopolyspora sp. NPDC049426 TaxID=3155652 RepID=UPI003430D174